MRRGQEKNRGVRTKRLWHGHECNKHNMISMSVGGHITLCKGPATVYRIAGKAQPWQYELDAHARVGGICRCSSCLKGEDRDPTGLKWNTGRARREHIARQRRRSSRFITNLMTGSGVAADSLVTDSGIPNGLNFMIR